MGKDTGFREFERSTHQYKPVEERIKSFFEFMVPLSKAEIETQGARCMNCGTPFCHPSCPLHNQIPDFNDMVYEGKWDEAYKILRSTNNFPEFTGKLCPAPCESGCVLGLIKNPVAIKSIELAIVEHAYNEGWVRPNPPKKRTGKKVAVVGSGPTGLTVADQLNNAGHEVTVFEKSDRVGGLLQYGIPNFKLDKKIIKRRIIIMEAEGIIFKTGSNIGIDIPASRLQDEFDAIVLAGGSTIPRDLPIPGREMAKGVHFAMEFLVQNNKRVAGDKIPEGEEILATGKNVLVIGGGDTGSDCVGTSIRQGAKSVTQIELLPKPPEGRTPETAWPQHPGPRMFSTSTSQEEGCRREWSVLSKEFVTDNDGNVAAVKYKKIEWQSKTAFEELEGTEGEYKVDLVMLAMGFMYPDANGIIKDLGLELDNRGNVMTGPDYQTSMIGIFAAGDMRTGQSLIVSCISEGRECARYIDMFLRGGHSRLESKNQSFCKLS